MGTSIELKVSGVSLDCAKNNMGNDYGYLFQESDLARRPCDGIDYDYYRNHPEDDDDLAEIVNACDRINICRMPAPSTSRSSRGSWNSS